MEFIYFYPNLRSFTSYIHLGIFVLCIISRLSSAALIPAPGNDTDRLALLDFKSRISQDPFQIMASWNHSVHHCRWEGVTCSPSNGRVMIINLLSKKLAGSIPPSIANLTYLIALNLRNNSFHGKIPPEIGRLLRLQHLNLTYNFFSGDIPTNLMHCTELEVLDLVYNELVGRIPDQLSSLSKLLHFGLGGNNLTGGFPAWIGNFSSLQKLTFALNNLQGGIPPELGRLSRLRVFQIYGNELSGTIPSSIYNLSSLYYFSVTQNQLHGELPRNVGVTLPNLEIFAGGVNNFHGEIPVSLSNASKLGVIDFAENALTGTVPVVFGKLQNLYRFNFDDNKLGSKSGDLNFISFLANCTVLEVLGLRGNSFGGELPASIANLSVNLSRLTLGSNFFHGKLPVGIGNLVNLNSLGLEGNSLSESIPDVVGNLKFLQGLYLNYNNFSGKIPPSIGNLTFLTRLFMENNRLEGTIPLELGKCRSLEVLNFTGNRLTGSIPGEVAGLSSLSISLAISGNSLSGSLPLEVGKLVNLQELDFSENRLSGEIPSTLSSCLSLERLLLSGNLLHGTIPESLKTLRGIAEIDFSRNNLSGEIPVFLGKLSALKKLNLSFNKFAGRVPTEGIFANASAISLVGNERLCGGLPDLNLPECPDKTSRRTAKFRELKVLIPAIISIVFLVALFCALAAYFTRRRYSESPSTSTASTLKDWELGISFQEVSKLTNGFSVDNLIGSGSFGSVYKGVLHGDGPIVAVKILNLQQKGASKSFEDELKALSSIRHRNLLKIIAACSSIDPQGNDFKCLVFEFMSNGNLDQWLHPRNDYQSQTSSLDIVQRLNIAVDVASALDYLHNYCGKPIVHCDIKPSNILLDDDMTAHVSDFGLATFLLEDSTERQAMSARLKGSIGYIPPGMFSID